MRGYFYATLSVIIFCLYSGWSVPLAPYRVSLSLLCEIDARFFYKIFCIKLKDFKLNEFYRKILIFKNTNYFNFSLK